VSAEANAAGGFLRRIIEPIIAAGRNTGELTAEMTALRAELAKANAAAGQNTAELRAPVAQLRTELEEELPRVTQLRTELEEELPRVTQLRTELEEELSRVAQLRAKLEAELSKGFLRRLFGPRPQISEVQPQTSEDMERTRELTRRRIAYALIATLVAVVVGTIVYIAWLTGVRGLDPQEVINVMQGLGTTLLAPIVGLIGAVIGFYYGGQTAVSGTESARAAATEAATGAATGAARQAATQVAQRATEEARQVAQRATEEARQVAQRATEEVRQVATEAATEAATGAARQAAADVLAQVGNQEPPERENR
jgi:hypothetical protein